MKRFSVLFLIFILLGVNKLSSNELQYYSHYEIISTASDNIQFKVKPEVRYNVTDRNHYYTHFDIGFDWAITNWFVVAPYYRHVNESSNNNWLVEYRPHLNAIFSGDIVGLSLSNANRIEFRIKESGQSFRYINNSKIKSPKFTKLSIQPYIAEEFYYDFNVNKLNRNRIYAGLNFNIIGNLSAGIVYVLEGSLSQNDWTYKNIISTSLKYNL